jgi:hypothetical protein
MIMSEHAYEAMKALALVEQRIRNIEDTMTGAASYACDRRSLNARVMDEVLWALHHVEQAKALISTRNNNASNSAQNDNKPPIPSA